MHQNEWTVHHHGKDIWMFTIKCSCIPDWLLNFFIECWDCVTACVGKENEQKQMIFRIKCYTIQGTPINLVILPVKMQSRLQMLVPYQLYDNVVIWFFLDSCGILAEKGILRVFHDVPYILLNFLLNGCYYKCTCTCAPDSVLIYAFRWV